MKYCPTTIWIIINNDSERLPEIQLLDHGAEQLQGESEIRSMRATGSREFQIRQAMKQEIAEILFCFIVHVVPGHGLAEQFLLCFREGIEFIESHSITVLSIGIL